MCVIITSPDKKHRPTLKTLRQCEAQNPHGNGLAWVQGATINWIKGLSAEAIHEHLGILDGPVVIHFRYATVGGKQPSLCHPFPVTDDAAPSTYGEAKEVLFHNGHWGDWEKFVAENDIKLGGPVSDSRVIAIGTYLGGFEWLRNVPGRFVVFNKRGIKHFGDWHVLSGMQFSNLNWQPRVKAPAPRPALRPAPAPAAKPQREFELTPRGPRGRSLVEQAMACFGD